MKRALFVLAAVLGLASSAQAQVPVAPSTATFTYSDAEFAIVDFYHTDFYSCASVTVSVANPTGVCVGRAATPFQSGFDTPKAQITGTSPTRVINLKAAPASGVLASVPNGTGVIAVILSHGDVTVPGIAGVFGPPSNDSNPFFSAARTPAAPGPPVVR